ncbi:MAG TPA: hypothetical protein VH851_06750 [Candidatus Binatia bacterium]|jgi:hypothetical protein
MPDPVLAEMVHSRTEAQEVVAQLRAIPERERSPYEIVEAVTTVIKSIKDRK